MPKVMAFPFYSNLGYKTCNTQTQFFFSNKITHYWHLPERYNEVFARRPHLRTIGIIGPTMASLLISLVQLATWTWCSGYFLPKRFAHSQKHHVATHREKVPKTVVQPTLPLELFSFSQRFQPATNTRALSTLTGTAPQPQLGKESVHREQQPPYQEGVVQCLT